MVLHLVCYAIMIDHMVLLIIPCTCKCFDIINFLDVASLPAKCKLSEWVSPDNNSYCVRPTDFCIQCTVVYVCQKNNYEPESTVRPCMLSAHSANMLMLGQRWPNVYFTLEQRLTPSLDQRCFAHWAYGGDTNHLPTFSQC